VVETRRENWALLNVHYCGRDVDGFATTTLPLATFRMANYYYFNPETPVSTCLSQWHHKLCCVIFVVLVVGYTLLRHVQSVENIYETVIYHYQLCLLTANGKLRLDGETVEYVYMYIWCRGDLLTTNVYKYIASNAKNNSAENVEKRRVTAYNGRATNNIIIKILISTICDYHFFFFFRDVIAITR